VFSLTQSPRKSLSLTAWILIVLASVCLSSAIILTVIALVDPAMLSNGALASNNNSNPLAAFAPQSVGEKVMLVMGVDANYDAKDPRSTFEGNRTDTMMLVRISAKNKTVSIVSIPRDSKVYLAGNHGVGKINSANAIGGADLAVQTVESSFGIPVDNYMVINFSGVREVVDALGGIDIYVEKPMHYTDNTAKLKINFDVGNHHLDGKQAEAFLRFRHDELGDIGRIRRQQYFVSALTKKMRNPMVISQLPSLIGIMQKYVRSNLSTQEMLQIAAFVKDLDMRDIRVSTLPGRPSGGYISYWLVSPDSAQQVLDRMILNNAATAATDITSAPMKLGIFYSPAMKETLPQLEETIKKAGFDITCRSVRSAARTQIIEHSRRVTDESTQKVRESYAGLRNVPLIFAPAGTTFENMTCDSSDDYTIVLGEDQPGRGN
jgi:LCP family protein required for cell wall assembly